mmetsp:Transcript_22624/g.40492  ORF Transcript_22624/g.40492 Transcript_22624/m.40492 type:complete len:87 (-) Transcript_22624:26-286(-)
MKRLKYTIPFLAMARGKISLPPFCITIRQNSASLRVLRVDIPRLVFRASFGTLAFSMRALCMGDAGSCSSSNQFRAEADTKKVGLV